MRQTIFSTLRATKTSVEIGHSRVPQTFGFNVSINAVGRRWESNEATSSQGSTASPEQPPPEKPQVKTKRVHKERPLRRAMLYVPGSDERKLKKSLESSADALCYDLEDSVANHKKGEARGMVVNALNATETGKHECLVRINSLGTGLAPDDLQAVLSCPRLDGIVIPKVTSADDIRTVTSIIDQYGLSEEARKSMRLVASIESAEAIINLQEIATASSRVDALLFAAEDFCADTGIIRTSTRSELLYARSAIVMAARAFKLQAIDMVCVSYKELSTLETECQEGRNLGFDGKQAIHPSQVDTIQQHYVPSQRDIERALAILKGYKESEEGGKGAYGLDGVMIDAPMILQANRVVAIAKLAGLIKD